MTPLAPRERAIAPPPTTKMTTQTFTNVRLFVGDELIHGSLHIDADGIRDISSSLSQTPSAIDCEGDYMAPGLIELHTDNLERHLQPRPGVHYPHHAALLAHDRELASTGITTVFDALRIGSVSGDGVKYKRYARECAHEISKLKAQRHFSISHFLHLRAEVCSDTLCDEIAEFTPDDGVGIVSLMDHTPGQRQFRDASKLEDYLRSKYGMSEAQVAEHFAHLKDLQARHGAKHEAAVLAFCADMSATLASHDDTTTSDVERSQACGVGLAEFPTTLDAAQRCHAHGIPVMMGAPNLVRGGSHSGNIAAMDLVDQGLLDIISSDYIPNALLFSAIKVGLRLGNLNQGMAMITRAPAAAVGLHDRGEITIGRRADLVRFSLDGDTPVIRSVWHASERVS